MKCSCCGSSLNDNAKFCRECGKAVVAETEVPDVPSCPVCKNKLEAGMVFCNKCGHKVKNETDEIEHRYCPKCGKPINKNALFCRGCGIRLAANTTGGQEKLQKKKDVSLIVLIIILIVVLLGCGATLFWTYHANRNDISTEFSDGPIESEKKDNAISKDEETNETRGIGDDADEAASNDISLDASEFSYALNQTNINANPVYKTVSDSEYNYYCAVPAHFVEDVAGHMYHAPDKTALMNIYAESNVYDLNVEQVMNQYIYEVGGTVTYSASGDTWFAVSMEKDGVTYYMKGFVDHYIREFTFNYPSEYVEVYDKYINYIEDHFKRMDV